VQRFDRKNRYILLPEIHITANFICKVYKKHMTPVLYIFSGLPGSGKSTLAKGLVTKTNAAFFRIDTIEQGIIDLCSFRVQGEGYRLTYRIAEDNLLNGNSVVADSCNPWKMTRDEWENVALKCNSHFVNIEVVCSDKVEWKQRVDTRISEINGLVLPTWEQIQKREYHVWDKDHVVIDTAHKTVAACLEELFKKLEMIRYE
jgi:predicted kinase